MPCCRWARRRCARPATGTFCARSGTESNVTRTSGNRRARRRNFFIRWKPLTSLTTSQRRPAKDCLLQVQQPLFSNFVSRRRSGWSGRIFFLHLFVDLFGVNRLSVGFIGLTQLQLRRDLAHTRG